MTKTTKNIVKMALPAVALTMSVLGVANAHSQTERAEPVSCDISVSKGRYGTTYEGVVQSDTAIKGTYELMIKKRGTAGRAMISQGGDFYVPAGGTETLGQTTFGGLPPEKVEAELTLRWKGHKMTCTNATEI